MKNVAVFGCGYVGITVAVEAARAGYRVIGIEPDPARIESLRRGVAPASDSWLCDEDIAGLAKSGALSFDDSLRIEPEIAIICVPTPLRDGQPDVSFIEAATESIGRRLQPDTLVVLESTTYPGTTEEIVAPILERTSGLGAGIDFHVAFSPERVDPGNRSYGLKNTPKIVGGLTEECAKKAAEFYRDLVDQVVIVSSPRAAEMTKLLENSYRHVNIALANEMAIVCHDLSIDPWEVIEAASTKPFGFTPFLPGPGVGGHCIPVDSQYLAWRVRGSFGHQFRIIEVAQDVNERMPAYVASRAAEILNEAGKAVRGASILLIGVAYKRGSSDIRESPALRVAARLARMGGELRYHDPHVPETTIGEDRQASQSLTPEFVRGMDLVLVLTDHPDCDYALLADNARLIYDSRNALKGSGSKNVYRS